jgi:hypothetical protein
MGASKELKEEFENWLKENNVSYFTKTQDAREYVVWTEHDNSKVREWLRARLPETVYAATVGQPASSASGAR